jgi:hypothetical protein
VTAVVVTAVVATATCCSSAATTTLCGASPVAALPVTRGALDERRLVGMDASALSAFASARGGAVGATLRTRNRKGQTHAPRNGVSGRAMAYLRVEKPCFLFLEGSAGAEATVDASTVAPPDASAARAGTSAACVASSVDRSAADTSAPAPGACSFAASAALGEGA